MSLTVICGKKRSGKDEFAKAYLEHFGSSAKAYALAHPIKQALYFGYYKVVFRRLDTFSSGMPDSSYELWTGNGVLNGAGVDLRSLPLTLSHEQVQEILMYAWDYVVSLKPEYKGRHSSLARDKIISLEPERWSIRRLMQVFGTDIGVAVDENIWIKFAMDVYIDCIRDNMSLLITDVRQEHEMKVARALNAQVIFVIRDTGDENKDDHITERGLDPIQGDVIIHNDGTLAEYIDKVNEQLRKM